MDFAGIAALLSLCVGLIQVLQASRVGARLLPGFLLPLKKSI
jgi:hypothetical protein